MDTKSHLQMIVDKLNEQCDLLMFSMHREPSGSLLLKARYQEDHDGGLCTGGVTQNESIYLKRKNTKQINRDLNRAKQNHAQSSSSRLYDLRSKMSQQAEVEKPRCEQVSPEEKLFATHHEVTSPIETVGSGSIDYTAESPDLQLGCSPELPPMREPDHASAEKSDLRRCQSDEIVSSDLVTVSSLDASLNENSLDLNATEIDSKLQENNETFIPSQVCESNSNSETRSTLTYSDEEQKIRLAIRLAFQDVRKKLKEPDG